MSDHSYYIVHQEPPLPKPTPFQWVASYFRPLRFVTEGRGRSDFGAVRSERRWMLSRGRLTQFGIDHTFPVDA